MRARPVIDMKCERCGRYCMVRRVRGPWQGVVQVVSGDYRTVRLPRDEKGGYTLAGFLCGKCRA
jgi:hypothetical protein